MKDAEDILDDELSDEMIDYLSKNPTFKGWIMDAMYAYAQEYHNSEKSKKAKTVFKTNEILTVLFWFAGVGLYFFFAWEFENNRSFTTWLWLFLSGYCFLNSYIRYKPNK